MNTLVERLRAFLRRVFFWLPSGDTSEERIPETVHHDHALILAVQDTSSVPGFRQLRYVSRVLSLDERRIVLGAILLFLISGGIALGFLISQRTISVPVAGGSITEALVGEPKYINPLDAPANDVDRDLSSLIFSGLFRMNGTTVEPDLAEKYNWSDDGKTLTVSIRSDARFHDGTSVTADDVQYTIDEIQDPARTSPLAPVFSGVKVVATNAQTVVFTLDHPDVTFLTSLTVGIVPSQLWQEVPASNARLSDLNLKPIGSGPYRFASFTRDNHGFIRSFTLERYDRYYGIKPFINTVVFEFFPDRSQAEDALKGDLVEALAFASPDVQKNASRWHQVQLQLPQETVAFFNMKNKTLADTRVRQALGGSIDRQEMIDAWQGRATAIMGPFPFSDATTSVMTLDQSRAMLDAAGWVLPPQGGIRIYAPPKPKPVVAPPSKSKSKKTPVPVVVTPVAAPIAVSSTELELTITTSDQPEIEAVAEALKRRWSLLGAKVTIEALAPEDLLRRASRERNAQIVLTDILLGPEQNLFPFWWSGQAVDRGLNISNLTDRNVDTLLQAAESASSTDALDATRKSLSQAILNNTPAIFLVRPSASYLVSKKISGVSDTVVVSRPADRFQDLLNWYVKTGWRWK